MSRSGTTWASAELSRHPDVMCYGEVAYWGRIYLEPDGEDGRYTLERTRERFEKVAAYFGEYVEHEASEDRRRRYELSKLGHIPIDRVRAIRDGLLARGRDAERGMSPLEIFEAMNDEVGEQTGASIVIEGTPHHLNHLDRVFGADPGALVAVFMRTPYKFMLSYKHRAGRADAAAAKELERLFHPAFCAFVWRNYARSARAAASKHGDKLKVVWLESTKSAKPEVVRDVAAFFGIDNPDFFLAPAETSSATNTSFERGERPELGAQDRFWLNVIAKKEMRLHGIEIERAGFAPFAVLGSLCLLPVRAFQTWRIMSKRVDGSLARYFKRIITGR